ncbi:MAG: hypothetical protein H0V91_13925 [Flavisolibacter sp.]|nr:hypothetical protein [Flavisolibacter sp.]
MNKNRPFFGSTQLMELTAIDNKEYLAFIENHSNNNKRKDSVEALEFISDWTRLHTYYTQVVCNKTFATGLKTIEIADIKNICTTLLKEQETIFFQYRNLLTAAQWQLLTAVAKEEKLYKPGARDL